MPLGTLELLHVYVKRNVDKRERISVGPFRLFDVRLVFLPSTFRVPEDNRKSCLDGLPCPPWRKMTQSRSTIKAYFFAKLSTRSLSCCIQHGRTATSIFLIRHGWTSPGCHWNNCWEGVGHLLFIPTTSKPSNKRCESPLRRESLFRKLHE